MQCIRLGHHDRRGSAHDASAARASAPSVRRPGDAPFRWAEPKRRQLLDARHDHPARHRRDHRHQPDRPRPRLLAQRPRTRWQVAERDTDVPRHERHMSRDITMVGVLRTYCNRPRETSDLCSLMEEALSSTPRLRTRTPSASPRPKKLPASVVSRLVAAYAGGMAIHEIAMEFKINRVTVSKHLERAGVSKRPRSMSEEQIDTAVWDYATGQSLEKIGNRLGFDSTTVLKELRLRGVRMRDTHGRQK